MTFTEGFVRQHDEIMLLVGDMNKLLDQGLVKTDANRLKQLLTKLTAKIQAHLVMEDKVLYPKLYCHKEQKVRSTAKEFFEQMGGLSCVFKVYSAKWTNEDSIKDNPEDFIIDTKTVFSALGERIERENKHLYPMADKNI